MSERIGKALLDVLYSVNAHYPDVYLREEKPKGRTWPIWGLVSVAEKDYYGDPLAREALDEPVYNIGWDENDLLVIRDDRYRGKIKFRQVQISKTRRLRKRH